MTDNDFQKGILVKQYRISIFKEVFRKSIHLCSAFVPTLLSVAYKPVLFLLLAALVLYSFTEFIRLKVGSPILCSNSAMRSSLTAMSKRSPHFL